jgi:excisionase family DNA binding protein
VLDARQAARKAGVSRSLVYAWCRAGGLRHYRCGRTGKRGCIRIAEADLEAFLAACKREGGPPAAAPLPLKHISVN